MQDKQNTKGFKLADGSLSSDYELGDLFVTTENTQLLPLGELFSLYRDGGTSVPMFRRRGAKGGLYIPWQFLAPTPDTRQKVLERKGPARIIELQKQVSELQRDLEKEKESHQLAHKLMLSAEKRGVQKGLEEASESNLVKIVDWRNEELEPNDIVVTEAGNCFSYGEYKDPKIRANYAHVLRINIHALPRIRTLTIEEAEKELGCRIIEDS